MKKFLIFAIGVAFLSGLGRVGLAQPAATMYTLEDIYDYLMEGVVATAGGHDFEPPAGAEPGDSRFKSLEQILDDIKAQFALAEGSSPQNVAEGVSFWSTHPDSWGPQTGELEVGGGGMISTGQTMSYYDYDDGYYKKGPARDYTINQDGTVTDNVTGLMWAASGVEPGCKNGDRLVWWQSIDWANSLTFAGYSDWRLPNVIELMSIVLIETTQTAPFVNKTAFYRTRDDSYWSSTSGRGGSTMAYNVSFKEGFTGYNSASNSYSYVRAVRDVE